MKARTIWRLKTLAALSGLIALGPVGCATRGAHNRHYYGGGKSTDRSSSNWSLKNLFGHEDSSGDPPGWDRGRKTGWNGKDEPPGQAKKHDSDWDDNHGNGNGRGNSDHDHHGNSGKHGKGKKNGNK